MLLSMVPGTQSSTTSLTTMRVDLLYMGRNEVRYIYINKPHWHHGIHKYPSSACGGVCRSRGRDEADIFEEICVI